MRHAPNTTSAKSALRGYGTTQQYIPWESIRRCGRIRQTVRAYRAAPAENPGNVETLLRPTVLLPRDFKHEQLMESPASRTADPKRAAWKFSFFVMASLDFARVWLATLHAS
ncbi:hypothetical protein [Mycobacterium parmense]|uniref:Uncharacterized protein n=1 Tax=Mycobacterium parmense TaxID=185642 RepID=A0A7I7YXM7_9MYCO|nr:hypothetical protein [Mycobacterium parmense]MCV7350493.1 hypothetical protein [Mycobacterium parmense]BBZ46082.1 hypothetical protein MPRM_33630 [Mycobacterium parmense]